MATNDFYVSFGSNAGTWAKRLGAQLGPATAAINTIEAGLIRTVEQAKEAARLAEAAANAAHRSEKSAFNAGAGGGTASQRGHSPGGQNFDVDFFTDLKRGLAKAADTMESVVVKMSAAADMFETGAKNVPKAVTKANRGVAQSDSALASSKTTPRFRTNAPVYDYESKRPGRLVGGRTVSNLSENRYFDAPRGAAGARAYTIAELTKFIRPGAGGAMPGTGQAGRQGVRPAATAARGAVTLTGTPTVMIEEAAFNRVVAAIEAGTSESESIRQNTQEILAHLRRNPPPRGGAQPAPTAPTAPPTPAAPAAPAAAAPVVATSDAAETAVTATAQKAANEQLSAGQIQHQIAKRQRLAALKLERERLKTGGAFEQSLFDRAAQGSTRLQTVGATHGYAGDSYIKSLDNAIKNLTEEVKGSPRVSTLRRQLESLQTGVPMGAVPTRQQRATQAALGGTTLGTGETINKAEAEQRLPAQEARLDNIDAKIIELMALLSQLNGPAAEAIKEQLTELRKLRNDEAKAVADLRKATGMAQKERRAAAAEHRATVAEQTKHVGGQSNALNKYRRAEVKEDLALGAGGTEQLQEMLRRRVIDKDRLRRIASSYKGEGYELAFDPMAQKAGGKTVTNDRLLEQIADAQRRFEQSGGTTVHNLNTTGEIVTTKLGPAVKNLVGAVERIHRQTTAEAAAFAVENLNRTTGGQSGRKIHKAPGLGARGDAPVVTSARRNTRRIGTDPLGVVEAANQGLINRPAKVAKGRVMRGSAFGGAADAKVDEAEKVVQSYFDRTGDAMLAQTLTFMREQKFNPHDNELDAQIEGNDATAKQARKNLASLRRYTKTVDDAYAAFLALDNEAEGVTKAMARNERALNALAKKAFLTTEQEDRRAQLLEEQNQLGKRSLSLQQKLDTMEVGRGVPASEFDSPERRMDHYRRRMTFAVEQKRREEDQALTREAMLNRQAYEEGADAAAFDIRQRTHIGSGRNGPIGQEMFTSALPGIRRTSQNGLQALNPSAVDPKIMQKLQRYWNQWKKIDRQLAMGELNDRDAAEAVKGAKDAFQSAMAAYRELGLGIEKFAWDDISNRPYYTNNALDTARLESGPQFRGNGGGERVKPPREAEPLLEGQSRDVPIDPHGFAEVLARGGRTAEAMKADTKAVRDHAAAVTKAKTEYLRAQEALTNAAKAEALMRANNEDPAKIAAVAGRSDELREAVRSAGAEFGRVLRSGPGGASAYPTTIIPQEPGLEGDLAEKIGRELKRQMEAQVKLAGRATSEREYIARVEKAIQQGLAKNRAAGPVTLQEAIKSLKSTLVGRERLGELVRSEVPESALEDALANIAAGKPSVQGAAKPTAATVKAMETAIAGARAAYPHPEILTQGALPPMKLLVAELSKTAQGQRVLNNTLARIAKPEQIAAALGPIVSGEREGRVSSAEANLQNPTWTNLLHELDALVGKINSQNELAGQAAREQLAVARRLDTEQVSPVTTTDAEGNVTTGRRQKRRSRRRRPVVISPTTPGVTPEVEAPATVTIRVEDNDVDTVVPPGGRGPGVPTPVPVPGAMPGGGNLATESTLSGVLKRLEAIHVTLKNGIGVRVSRPGQRMSGEQAKAASIDPERTPKARAANRRRIDPTTGTVTSPVTGLESEDEARAKADDLLRQRQEQKAKNTVQGLRNDARASEIQRLTTDRLSASTRNLIKELGALKAAGKSSGEIALKQAEVFAKLSGELKALGVNASGIRTSFQQVSHSVNLPVNQFEISNIQRLANVQTLDPNGSKDNKNKPAAGKRGRNLGSFAGEEMGDGLMEAFESKMFGNNGFWSRVMNSTGTFIVRNFTAGFVFGITAALQDVIAQAIETEATFVRVSHALESTGRSTAGVRGGLAEISTSYGVALTDVYNTAAGLVGIFEDPLEIVAATDVATQLQMISNGALNATEAMGTLASISSAFDLGRDVDDVRHVADVLTTIQNELGVNIENSAEGVARLAGLANQLKMSFEETAVYTAEIGKRTNQTGAAAGEQFSRMVAVMQTGRGQKALTEALGQGAMRQTDLVTGEQLATPVSTDVGMTEALSSGNYAQAVRLLMENYVLLDQAQQDNIATTIGGQRQAAAFQALLKDGANALDVVRKATYDVGSAQERADKIAGTLNNQLKVFHENLVAIGAALVEGGILDGFGILLKNINAFTGGLTSALTAMNEFGVQNPFIGFLTNAALGALGVFAAFKLAKAAVRGMRAAMITESAAGTLMRGARGELTEDEKRKVQEARERRGPGFRERADAVRTRAVGLSATPINRPTFQLGMGGGRDVPAPTRATSLLGRGLERVTAGPLRLFGTGLTMTSNLLRDFSTNQRANNQNIRSRVSGGGAMVLGGLGGNLANRAGRWENTLRGRSDLNAFDRADRWNNRANAMGARADNALRYHRTVPAAGFAAMGLAAKAMSGGANLAGKSMRLLAGAGMAAQAALSTLSVVAIAVIAEMMRTAELQKEVEDAFKSRFTAEGRGDDDSKAEGWVGQNTDILDRERRNLGGFGGFMRALGQGINPANLWRYRDENVLNGDYQEKVAARNAGELDAETQGGLDKYTSGAMGRMEALREKAKSGVATVGDITDMIDTVTAEVDAEANKLLANDTLSPEQLAAGGAALEAFLKNFQEQADAAIREAEGLAASGRLSTTRINELIGLAGTLASAPSAGLNYPKAIEQLMEEYGPQGANSQSLKDNFKTLSSGYGSTETMLKAQLAITEEAITQAQMNLAAAVDEDDINERAEQLKSLVVAAEQQRRAIAEAEMSAARELATFYAHSGQYGRAAATLAGTATEIRERVFNSRAKKRGSQSVPEGTKTYGDDEEVAMLNQAAQLEQSANENAVTEATREKRIAMRGTRNSSTLAQLTYDSAVIRLDTLKARNASDQEIQDAEDAVIAAANANLDSAVSLAQAMDAANLASVRGSVARAAAEEAIAGRNVDRMLAAGFDETSPEVINARAATVTAGQATRDAKQAQNQSWHNARAAGMWNSVSRAREEESAALDALAYARQEYTTDSQEYQDALARYHSSQQGTVNALTEETAAARDLALARIAPGDLAGRADKTYQNALAAQAEAAKYGTNSSQYVQATIAVIEAMRGTEDVARQIAEANANLNIAMLEYAGHTVEAAKAREGLARQALTDALARSGGAESPDVINARAAVRSAEGTTRDTVLQDALGTIDFQQQMDQITSRGAIAMLQQLLNMKDLTEAQRRDILLKIKGLQDELASSMEGAFNLPQDIKVPTPYEVRRAIGVDDYIQSMKDATSTSAITSAMPSASNPAQILREIQGALAAGPANSVAGAVQDYSNSNNNVTINGASFEQVVSYLNQYLGAGAQVVRTNAGRKGY